MFLRRWSPRSKLLALLAVVCGLGAYLLVRGYEARLEALRPAVGAPRPVVVAAAALTKGTALSEEHLRLERMPSAFAPPGAVGEMQQVLGQTLVADVAAGEVLTAARLGTAGGPVASLVPSGLRAFVVPSGMPAGALRPGDRVDVIATFGGPRPYAETVATGLEVVGVMDPPTGGAALVSASDAGPALVLLTSPHVAERLAYAKAFADLTVTVAPVVP